MNSTAWNVDYTIALRRACYEGLLRLGRQIRGDMEGCVGLWFTAASGTPVRPSTGATVAGP